MATGGLDDAENTAFARSKSLPMYCQPLYEDDFPTISYGDSRREYKIDVPSTTLVGAAAILAVTFAAYIARKFNISSEKDAKEKMKER